MFSDVPDEEKNDFVCKCCKDIAEIKTILNSFVTKDTHRTLRTEQHQLRMDFAALETLLMRAKAQVAVDTGEKSDEDERARKIKRDRNWRRRQARRKRRTEERKKILMANESDQTVDQQLEIPMKTRGEDSVVRCEEDNRQPQDGVEIPEDIAQGSSFDPAGFSQDSQEWQTQRRRRRMMYIGNCRGDYRASELERYLAQRGVKEAKCQRLTGGATDARRSSFKVKIFDGDRDTLVSLDIFKNTSIYVRDFFKEAPKVRSPFVEGEPRAPVARADGQQ